MNQRGVFHPRLWTKLRALQGYAFPDHCKILVFAEVVDELGNVAENYTASSEIACRFNVKVDSASQGYEILGQSEIPRNSTFVSFAINSTTSAITEQDRIRITRRQGDPISPNEDYEVASPVIRGTANIVVRLRPVDDYIDPA